jgi:hypothetical protein
LVKRQIKHWDKSVRLLSAEALSVLVATDPKRFVDSILPTLLDQSLSQDLPTRHGSALAVAKVVIALKESGHPLSEELNLRIVELVPAIEKARLYRCPNPQPRTLNPEH